METRKCKMCGNDFETDNSKREFCTKKCADKYAQKLYLERQKEERRAKGLPLRGDKVKGKCEICGNDFEYIFQNSPKHTCSPNCSAKRSKRLKDGGYELIDGILIRTVPPKKSGRKPKEKVAKSRKKEDNFIAISRKAKEMNMSYGQLQALIYQGKVVI